MPKSRKIDKKRKRNKNAEDSLELPTEKQEIEPQKFLFFGQ